MTQGSAHFQPTQRQAQHKFPGCAWSTPCNSCVVLDTPQSAQPNATMLASHMRRMMLQHHHRCLSSPQWRVALGGAAESPQGAQVARNVHNRHQRSTGEPKSSFQGPCLVALVACAMQIAADFCLQLLSTNQPCPAVSKLLLTLPHHSCTGNREEGWQGWQRQRVQVRLGRQGASVHL